MSIEHLVPDSNRLENFLHIPLGLADSAGLRNLMGVAMANAYQAGFQGCFTTSPDSPPWAVKVAEMGIDAFREAVGRNHYTVEQVMPAALQGEGKGKRAANCAYIMKLMPSGLAGSQDYGNCFPAGTLVRLADGTHKPIEQITVTDTVVTAEGRTGAVYCVMSRPFQGSLRRISLWGHHGVAMTPEHPVLTRRGYVEAKDVRLGEWVALPKYAAQTRSILATALHATARDRTYVLRNVRAVHTKSATSVGGVRTTQRIVKNAVPDAIPLDYDFGWMIGLFLAEGSTDNGKAVYSLCSDEENTHAARLVELLAKRFNVEAKIQRRTDKGVCLVVIHGRIWAAMMESLCGHGAAGKRLHPDLTAGPLEFLRGVFDGWMDGDGTTNRNRKVATTVSRWLAMDMLAIGNALGYCTTLGRSQASVNRYAASRLPANVVTFYTGQAGAKSKCRLPEQDDRHVWRKVRAVSDVPHDGPVYNLSVRGDESYTADGIGVHNCRSWSMRGGTMALAGMAVAKGQAVRLEHRHGTALVYGSRGHGGQGMDMGTGCKVVTAIGQSEEKDYGDGLDLSTESKDEAAGNRWGRGGPPAELVEAVRGDVVAKAWLLKNPTAEMVMDVFWAEGVIDTGSTMTAAKPKDGFLSGLTRIGGHAQCAMLYDDTDETREWYTKTTGNTINDFFVGVDQSWGEWMSFKYWPEHLWGPRPQGMWVITGSDFVRICKDWGDSWAMTGLQGFTPRTLPDWGSGEYL